MRLTKLKGLLQLVSNSTFKKKNRVCCQTSRFLCSGEDDRNDRLKEFKEKLFSKHYMPDPEHAKQLTDKFPDPKRVVDDLFSPFIKVDTNFAPTIDKKQKYNDNIVETKLGLRWPTHTYVCGKHKDEDTSLQNAYLEACELLMTLGLLKSSDTGVQVYTVDDVVKVLEDFACKQSFFEKESNNFRILNLLNYDGNELIKWTSSIQVLWPVSFTVTSSSSCLDLAYYQSSLRSLMKLKTLGFLDSGNNLKRALLIALQKYDGTGFKVRDLSNPDYEIFVDASKVGMGAYLLSKDDEKIRWLSDNWREDMTKFSPVKNIQLAELYALVTAIYTWKHKFKGKKVVCYSDNIHVVNILNHGYYSPHLSRKSKSLSKLFLVLYNVVYDNDMVLVADHVPRMNNVPADLLSRCNVDEFKKMVPTAFENPKKSKKLWFCNFNEDKPSDDDDKKPKS